MKDLVKNSGKISITSLEVLAGMYIYYIQNLFFKICFVFNLQYLMVIQFGIERIPKEKPMKITYKCEKVSW